MHTGLSKPFRHINMPLYHLKNPVDLELMADKIIQSCTGDQSLYIVDAFQQICLPAAIQLRKNIIQQKHRCIPDLFLHQIDLRKLQGKGRSRNRRDAASSETGPARQAQTEVGNPPGRLLHRIGRRRNLSRPTGQGGGKPKQYERENAKPAGNRNERPTKKRLRNYE